MSDEATPVEESPKVTATLKAIKSMAEVKYTKQELKKAEENIEELQKWTLRSVMESSLANALHTSFGGEFHEYVTKEYCLTYVHAKRFSIREIQCILDTAPKVAKKAADEMPAPAAPATE
jgi:hypothetical protein